MALADGSEFVDVAVGLDPVWAAKYFVFTISVIVGIPLGILLCRIDKRFISVFFILMVWSTCEPDQFGISFFTRKLYRAATRGIEINLADLCVVILLVSMFLRPKEYRFRWLIPLSIPYFLYIAISFISWSQSGTTLPVPGPHVTSKAIWIPPNYTHFELWLYPSFQIWKVMKGFLMCWVTANLVRDEEFLKTFVWSIVTVIVYLTIMSVKERYIGGVHRVAYSMHHPNDLATFVAAAGAAIFPFVYSARRFSSCAWMWIMFLSVVVIEILTISRGGLLAFGFGAFFLTCFLFFRHLNIRNLGMLALMACIGLGMFVIAKDTLFNRFLKKESVAGSMEERNDFSYQAVLMARDRLWGVGLGNFSAWSWNGYAEEVNPDLEPGVPVHNIWALNLGEVGWLGFTAFVLIWLRYYQMTLFLWFKRNSHMVNSVLLGCVAGTLAIHIQSLVHFSYRHPSVFMLLQLLMGISVGIYYLVQEQERDRKLRLAMRYS